jgi:hypothetical protein
MALPMDGCDDSSSARRRYPLHWRSRWLRAVFTIGLLMAALRVGWGWYAGRALAKRVAAIHRRGQPVWPQDVRFEAVPDSENAFVLQLRAARSTVSGVDSPRSSNLTYAGYPPYGTAWMNLASGSENAHGQVFALMRQARGLSRVRIQSGLSSPVLAAPLGHLNMMRHLANLVADGAIYKQVSGDDEEAVERTMDILHLTRSLRHDPFTLSQLVATGLDALACDAIAIIAPGVNAPEGSAVRRRVRELIARLLDERDYWTGVERSLEVERVTAVDTTRREAGGTWWLSPLADMEDLRTFRVVDAALEAARAGNKPGALAALAKAGPEDDGLVRRAPPRFPATGPGVMPQVPRYSRWFDPMTPTYSRFFEVHVRVLAERRSAAVSLAVRMYRTDRGKWPTKLEDLVPAYLPAVPADPFHDDGRRLGYVIARGALPDGGDRPMVYVDAGPPDPNGWLMEPTYSWEQSRTLSGGVRQYRDLSRWTPAPGRANAGVWSPKALGTATTLPSAGD